MRFSLRSMLATTALLAASCAGLLYANRALATWFFTTALLIVLFAVVAALVRRGPRRAYWIGFAVFAGPYFLYAMLGDVQPVLDREGRVAVWREPRLFTSQILLWADRWTTRVRPERPASNSPGREYLAYHMSFLSRGSAGHTLVIGHSVFTILLGAAGGSLGSLLGRRSDVA